MMLYFQLLDVVFVDYLSVNGVIFIFLYKLIHFFHSFLNSDRLQCMNFFMNIFIRINLF